MTFTDGCPECGVAYSFFFEAQHHKDGCSEPKPAADNEAFQVRVWASLDSAIENDYDFSDWTDAEVAMDLTDYNKQFEDIAPFVIAPYITTWRASRSSKEES